MKVNQFTHLGYNKSLKHRKEEIQNKQSKYFVSFRLFTAAQQKQILWKLCPFLGNINSPSKPTTINFRFFSCKKRFCFCLKCIKKSPKKFDFNKKKEKKEKIDTFYSTLVCFRANKGHVCANEGKK